MSNTIIKVDNLSKQYRIGTKEGYKTFRETIVDAAKAPFQLLSRLNPKSAIRNLQSETIWALRDVSFEVKQGEVVGIIGRNGAGKSTLLKILSKITEPTTGRVELRGRVGSLLEVGTGFHPELTGHENVYLYGAILGMGRWEITRKFDEIIAFAELEKFVDTPVKRYSSGMYMRLAFAVAANMETEILLVDEVLAVGDITFQNKCLGKMGDVANEGRTVIFVSHNMAAVLNLCTTAILIDNGQIVSQDRVNNVVNDYLDRNIVLQGEIRMPDDHSSPSGDFRFRAVRIHNSSGQLTSQIVVSEGFDIEIEYEVVKPVRGSNIGFILWNNREECVFTSTDIDMDPYTIDSVRSPGHYLAYCFIPAEYLRPGIYHIDVGASIPKVRVLDQLAKIISLEVVDDGSVESVISQGRQGVIAPRLTWNIRKL